MTLGVEPVYSIITWVDGASYGYAAGAIAISLIFYGLGILFYKCCKEKKLN